MPLSLLDRIGCVVAVFGFLLGVLWVFNKLIVNAVSILGTP